MNPPASPAWTTSRRGTLAGLGAVVLAACAPAEREGRPPLIDGLRLAEAAVGGTLGAYVFDTAGGAGFGWRQGERFAHCSSFKLSLAALVLALDAVGEIDAAENVRWTEQDVLAFSPFTAAHVADGATLRELARAAQVEGDNAAANILLRRLGGPARMTAFWRAMGDETSRLDRYEYDLNWVRAGEVHDTTTPEAMARTVARLLYGDALDAEDRQVLRRWAIETTNGLQRVRAGLPAEWIAGDKPGTSGAWPDMGSIHADVGFVEPPGRAPLTFAVYHRAAGSIDGPDPAVEAALSQVGAVIAAYVGSV